MFDLLNRGILALFRSGNAVSSGTPVRGGKAPGKKASAKAPGKKASAKASGKKAAGPKAKAVAPRRASGGAKGVPAKVKTGKPAGAREQALAQIRDNQAKVMTPERAELIRNAMAVHRAKQKILADLNDEDRQKLVAMAMRALLNEGRKDGS